MKKIIILLSIFSLSSCSLLNNASTNNEENNRKYSALKSIRSINKKANSIKYIQAKAKVSFRDNKKMKSNTVTFRITSGEKLWINAALGAARILIDNDSIKYYNKIEKNFFVTDFSYVNDKIGIKANFEILENLLLGMLIEKFSPSSLFEKSKRYRNLWLKENVSDSETLKVNQSEHAELMNLALERNKNGISKLIENHIMTPVEIIKKSLSQL